MLKTAFLAALAAVCLLSPAEARQRHASALAPGCNVLWPCQAPTESSPQKVRETRGRYVAHEMGIGAPIQKPAVRVRKAWQSVSYGVPARSFDYSVARPMRYIAGRLICAINVNSALAERGIRGTGSALAHSFDGWGVRVNQAVAGAVAVTDRRGGGHVALVSRVEGSRVFVWNPSSRGRGWQEVEYTNRHARYRVAG